MSWLSQAFGSKSNQNPADAARPYLDQIPGTLEKYYNPYIQQGQEAGARLGPEYERLMSDPSAFIAALQEGYKPSDQYEFNKEQGLGSMRNSAASGGFSGTPFDQQQQAQFVEGLLSNDEQQYLQNVLGAYGIGLGGEEKLQGQGFQAGLGLGDSLANSLMGRAGLEYQGVAQQNANNAALRNSLLSGATTGAGYALGKKWF